MKEKKTGRNETHSTDHMVFLSSYFRSLNNSLFLCVCVCEHFLSDRRDFHEGKTVYEKKWYTCDVILFLLLSSISIGFTFVPEPPLRYVQVVVNWR